MKLKIIYFRIIVPPGFSFIIDLTYGPIRSISTKVHGFSSEIILG